MLSNTLVYLIRTEISAISFFYTNVYCGLNVKKNEKLFLQRFHAFWPRLIFCTMLNLCILELSNTSIHLILTEISAFLFFFYNGLNVKK